MADNFIDILKNQLEGKNISPKGEEVGRVASVSDGVVQIEGLPNAMFSEMVQVERFPKKEGKSYAAMVLSLEEYSVGAVLFSGQNEVKEGDIVKRTGTVFSVPVGKELIGRVVNPLGHPKDGRGPLSSEKMEML